MTKVEMFKRELSDSINKHQSDETIETKLLFQELINRLDTYEEKKELVLHFENYRY